MLPKCEQQDEYGYEVWEENTFPLAYLLTFRTFGTWLPGDPRTAVKRDGWNRRGHPRYPKNETLERWMSDEMGKGPLSLTTKCGVWSTERSANCVGDAAMD